MATSLKISDEPLFTADDPRFREEMIWQYSANCAQAKVNKSGWATKKTHNPIEWTEAAPAPRQLERVAEAEARAEADRRKRVAAMVQLAEDSLAEQRRVFSCRCRARGGAARPRSAVCNRRRLRQDLDALGVALLLGPLQRRLAARTARRRVCARPQQAPHDGGVVEEGGVHQRGAAVGVLQDDLRAVP